MATNAALKRYFACYAMLLRLYPRPFRERFGEGLEQLFQDLCREHIGAGQGIFGFALWIFCETFAGIIQEYITAMNQLTKTMLRVALVSLGLLILPLVASQVVEGWDWKPGTFVFVYVLFFGTGMAYAQIASRMAAWSYKAGVGVALLAGFALGWSNMVHVAGSENPANLLYFSVLAVGVVGAWLARLQAPGLSYTLFAMAGTLILIALMLPSGAPPDLARNMAIGHGVWAALFAVSGLLFRQTSFEASN